MQKISEIRQQLKLTDTHLDSPITNEEQETREFDSVPVSSIKEVILCGCGSDDITDQEAIAIDNKILNVAAYAVEQEMLVAKEGSVEGVISNELMKLNIMASSHIMF